MNKINSNIYKLFKFRVLEAKSSRNFKLKRISVDYNYSI